MLFLVKQTSEFKRLKMLSCVSGIWKEHAMDNYEYCAKVLPSDRVEFFELPAFDGKKVLYIEMDRYYDLVDYSFQEITPKKDTNKVYKFEVEDETTNFFSFYKSNEYKKLETR